MTMFKRVAVGLTLALALSAAVLYYLHRGPSAAQSGNLPGLLELAPADAAYLVYVDVAAFRSSPFMASIDAWTAAAPPDPEYEEFIRATGLDYSRDLDRVVLAIRPGPVMGRAVALAEGRFDRARITSYALRTGKMEPQNGVSVYVVPGRSSPAKSFSFAFLNDRRVVLAEGPNLAPVLAARAPGGFDRALRERISRVAGAAFFAVGRVSSVPENLSFGGLRSDQFANLARSVRWFSLAARPEGDRMKVAAEAECDTSENARQMVGTLDGLRLLGLAALADPKTRRRIPPQTVALLETLLRVAEVSRDNQRVRLLLELTPEMLHAATGKAPAATPRGRAWRAGRARR